MVRTVDALVLPVAGRDPILQTKEFGRCEGLTERADRVALAHHIEWTRTRRVAAGRSPDGMAAGFPAEGIERRADGSATRKAQRPTATMIPAEYSKISATGRLA